ncbi:MAG: PAS domain S-box protein [Deltaproteobacteria bacterium]|nr:PAS domain S-box protein [Deltaproteobacteria bacterium]
MDEGARDLEIIFNESMDMVGVANPQGYFTRVNPSFERILGYTEEEFLAKPFLEFVYEKDVAKTKRALEDAAAGKRYVYIINRYVCKDGTLRWIEWHVMATDVEGKFVAVGRDITERLDTQRKIKSYSDDLESMVAERTRELESRRRKLKDLNTALNILLKKGEDEKTTHQERLLSNINRFVDPYLKKLASSDLNPAQTAMLEIAVSNLHEILQPGILRLSSVYLDLSPAELRVAELIRGGKKTKEIAAILNLSPKTIEVHRDNIREKLHIKNTKLNLQSYLKSLEHTVNKERGQKN